MLQSEGAGIDSRWCHWIFQWHIPSDHTMALGSTQPLVKMSTRVKAAGAWGWQSHHLHVLNVMKSGSLNLLEPSGPHRACYGTALHLQTLSLGLIVFPHALPSVVLSFFTTLVQTAGVHPIKGLKRNFVSSNIIELFHALWPHTQSLTWLINTFHPRDRKWRWEGQVGSCV